MVATTEERLVVTVRDEGVGIHATMRRACPDINESLAVTAAFSGGVTSEANPIRGLGLGKRFTTLSLTEDSERTPHEGPLFSGNRQPPHRATGIHAIDNRKLGKGNAALWWLLLALALQRVRGNYAGDTFDRGCLAGGPLVCSTGLGG